jgi:hypothetical protein
VCVCGGGGAQLPRKVAMGTLEREGDSGEEVKPCHANNTCAAHLGSRPVVGGLAAAAAAFRAPAAAPAVLAAAAAAAATPAMRLGASLAPAAPAVRLGGALPAPAAAPPAPALATPSAAPGWRAATACLAATASPAAAVLCPAAHRWHRHQHNWFSGGGGRRRPTRGRGSRRRWRRRTGRRSCRLFLLLLLLLSRRSRRLLLQLARRRLLRCPRPLPLFQFTQLGSGVCGLGIPKRVAAGLRGGCGSRAAAALPRLAARLEVEARPLARAQRGVSCGSDGPCRLSALGRPAGGCCACPALLLRRGCVVSKQLKQPKQPKQHC